MAKKKAPSKSKGKKDAGVAIIVAPMDKKMPMMKGKGKSKTCPECGAKMKGKTCPDCGYTEK